MNFKNSKKEIIYVGGHNGLVGSAIVKFLKSKYLPKDLLDNLAFIKSKGTPLLLH